jgi:hypothetical protein
VKVSCPFAFRSATNPMTCPNIATLITYCQDAVGSDHNIWDKRGLSNAAEIPS